MCHDCEKLALADTLVDHLYVMKAGDGFYCFKVIDSTWGNSDWCKLSKF